MIDLDATDLPPARPSGAALLSWLLQPILLLPLHIVCGYHLLGVRLRPANIDACAGALEEIGRIAKQIRQSWPQVNIILRADSDFCREPLLNWCEANRVDYVFGFARNERLRRIIEPRRSKPPRCIARPSHIL